MTARKTPAAAIRAGHTSPARRRAALAALGVAAFTAASALAAGGGAARADAAVATNCAAKPSACGYPDATNTGVPAGTTLKQVPSQVSSGPGWAYNAATSTVTVTAAGTTLSGLAITGTLQISANNVTVKNVQVTSGGNFGISLTHTSGVTIENSTVSGQNSTTGRVSYAIDDVYGDSAGMIIKADNISNFRTAVPVSTGQVDSNYIHDPGYVAGDHTNGIYVNGGTQSLMIWNNTIFDNLGQTDAINLDAGTPGPGAPVASKTVSDNLLAGGAYTLYGGAASGSPTSNIVIQDNRFAQNYYTKSGQYGPVSYFDPAGAGNKWSMNIWDTTGQTVPSP
jgi:Right handed beta helix region